MAVSKSRKVHGAWLLTLTLLLTSLALAGCSAGMGVGNSTPQTLSVAGLHGTVHGGQQPVSGANIVLWMVNTNGTAATSLLNNGATVTTGSNGTFTLTG